MSLPWTVGVALGVKWEATVSLYFSTHRARKDLTIGVGWNCNLVQRAHNPSHLVVLAMTWKVPHVHPHTLPKIMHDVHVQPTVVFFVMTVRRRNVVRSVFHVDADYSRRGYVRHKSGDKGGSCRHSIGIDRRRYVRV